MNFKILQSHRVSPCGEVYRNLSVEDLVKKSLSRKEVAAAIFWEMPGSPQSPALLLATTDSSV